MINFKLEIHKKIKTVTNINGKATLPIIGDVENNAVLTIEMSMYFFLWK